MTAAETPSRQTLPDPQVAQIAVPAAGRRQPWLWLGAALFCLLFIVVGVLGALRYGVLTSQGRHLIEEHVTGLPVSRFGRLQIDGLQGDLWRQFTVQRLAIADDAGVWVEVRNLDVTWDIAPLLRRRLHVRTISAGQVRLFRRPHVGPATIDRGLPLAFQLDRIRAPVEMLPAFSYRRGAYRADLTLLVERNGGMRGRVRADSLMHQGDYLAAVFDRHNRRLATANTRRHAFPYRHELGFHES